jgi:hypothetical protein
VVSPSAYDMTSATTDRTSEWDVGQVHGKAFAASGAISLRLAHERLGHINIAQVKRVAASDAVTGMRVSDGDFSKCMTCNAAKQKKVSFSPSTSRASKPLEIVHMDTIGPMPTVGFDGSQYAVPAHDDFSSFTTVLCVKSKDLVASKTVELLV